MTTSEEEEAVLSLEALPPKRKLKRVQKDTDFLSHPVDPSQLADPVRRAKTSFETVFKSPEIRKSRAESFFGTQVWKCVTTATRVHPVEFLDMDFHCFGDVHAVPTDRRVRRIFLP